MRHRRGRALRRRYHAGGSYGMQSHNLGNNESYGTGLSHHPNQSIPWLALTGTQSKWFKTQKGAERWLRSRGLDAHGRRIG